MENWDSYFCTVDEEPAFIVVNLGLASEAPLAGYPFLGYVSFVIRQPDESGFPDSEEDEALNELEDALLEAFGQGESARCAGHCLSGGRLDVYFYLRCAEAWTERVGAVLKGRTDHEWESGSHDDPDWEFFFDFLFPDEPALLQIQNRRMCAALEEQGHDLGQSRQLEHWAEFSTQEMALAFGKAARALGYSVEEPHSAKPGNEESGHLEGATAGSDTEEEKTALPDSEESAENDEVWQVRLARPDKPADIEEVSLALFDLAREHDGDYMGWACPGEEEETGESGARAAS